MEEPGYGRALNMYFIPLQPSHRLCESLLMFASPSLRRHAGGSRGGAVSHAPSEPPGFGLRKDSKARGFLMHITDINMSQMS